MSRRGLQGPPAVKLLLDHVASTQNVAGAISVLEYRTGAPNGQTGLWLEAHLDLDNPAVMIAYGACKKTGGLNFSVGFRTLTWSFNEDSNTLTVLTADLREVSLVVFPANEDCGMLVVKSEDGSKPIARVPEVAAPITLSEFEKMLVATGIVETRNKAHRITLEVKAHSHLFRKADETLVVESEVTPPVLAVAPPDFSAARQKAEELSALLKRFGE